MYKKMKGERKKLNSPMNINRDFNLKIYEQKEEIEEQRKVNLTIYLDDMACLSTY